MLSDYQKALAEFNKIPPEEVDAFPAERCSDPNQAKGSTWFRQDMIIGGGIRTKRWRYRKDAPVIDNGKSAFHEENFGPKAQLMIFLAAAKAGRIRKGRTILVFAHENRFTRAKIYKGKSILKELTDNGVYVYFVNSDTLLVPGWENDAKIDTYLTTAFDTARKEIELRAEYTTFSHLKKISDLEAGLFVNTGKYPWFTKFVGTSAKLPGIYKESDELVFPGTDNPLTWWDVAVRIKNEALGPKALVKIAEDLNADHIPCPNGGKKWRIGYLRNLLKSKLFLGIATFGGTTTNDRKKKVPGTKEFKIYPEVASLEEWNRIQHRFSKTNGHTGPNVLSDVVSHLFLRRAFCSACGGSLVVRVRFPASKHGSKHYENPLYRQYYCRNHSDAGACQVSVGLPVGPVEEDFCGNYLQQEPDELLRNEDEEQTQLVRSQEEKVSAATAEVERYQRMLKEAKNETASRAVMDLLNPAGKRLEDAQRELEKMSRPLSESRAPKALTSLQEALRGIDRDPSNPDAWRMVELPMARVKVQLSDSETRRKASELVPDLIEGIVVDLEKQTYEVKSLQGLVVYKRDLSPDIAAIHKESSRVRNKASWEARRRNGTASGYTFKRRKALKNGLTPVERVRKALANVQGPVMGKQLLKLCGMGFYIMKSALAELMAHGEVVQDAGGYKLKLPMASSD